MSRLALVILVLTSCGAPSMMSYHRESLDTLAQAQLDCERGPLDVVDTTPEDFVGYMHDPQARRYTVSGCGRSRAYLCYEFPMSTVRQIECKWLDPRNDQEQSVPVHLGPVQVN